MYAFLLRFCTLAIALSAVSCGSVVVAMDGESGPDDGSMDERAPHDATTVGGMDGSDGTDGSGAGMEGGRDAPGVDSLPITPCEQNGQLSYWQECEPGCAITCRDQLAKPLTACVSREGWTCVADCGVCP